MVQRHIFTPDQGIEQKGSDGPANPTNSAGLEKELVFTGILLTSKGKQVILAETGKNEKGIKKQILKEGESIKGMTIKEIGSNYMLLSSNENQVRMKLYAGIKNRPTPPPEAPVADAAKLPAPGNQAQTSAPAATGMKTDMKPINSPGGKVSPDNPSDDPGRGIFGGGRRKPGQEQASPETSAAPDAAPNPFLDVLKRATENAPSAAGTANPFTGK